MNNKQLTGQCDKHIHWFSEHTGIHQSIVEPWQALCDAARAEGFDLAIASGYRNFDRQLSIWNRKFTGKLAVKNQAGEPVDFAPLNDKAKLTAILLYSALPGASRHHWGCDIDFYVPNLLKDEQKLQLEPWEYQGSGPFSAVSEWLKEHAAEYGFYFPYDIDRGGVAPEPWHMSYAPLASQCMSKLSVDKLVSVISRSDIEGKSCIIDNINEIYTQYVVNVSPTPTLR